MTLPNALVSLSFVLTAAGSSPAASAVLPAVAAAAVGAACAGAWASRTLAQVQAATAKKDAALRALQEKLSKIQASRTHTGQNDKQALRDAEVALAAQKKKNFVQQAQLREAQAAAQTARARADEAAAAAQAARRQSEAQLLASAPKRAPETVSMKPQTSPVAQPYVAPIEAGADGDGPAPALLQQAVTDLENTCQALQAQLDAARSGQAEMQAKHAELAVKLKEARREHARKDKRIEDLRRVDLMSRGKIEVLEDKLKRMGRDLYETISALALAKGEVRPVPAPKALRTQNTAAQPHPAQATVGRPS